MRIHNQKTYAQETSNIPPTTRKRIPKITVKNIKTNGVNKQTFTKNVCDVLVKEKDIKTKQLRFVNGNEIEIKSIDEKSAETIVKLLNNKISDCCKASIEKIETPKMKIVGVDNYTNMSIKDIEEDINTKNFSDYHGECKVLHINIVKRTNKSSIIIEVPRVLYKAIIDNKNRVFIGYQSCKVWDLINNKPCLNCARFGHNTLKCKNELCCLKCAGKHFTQQCDNQTEKACVNCFHCNTKYETNLEIDHMANDTVKCSILKRKIERYIDMTDYPINPTIPRYVGNVENYRKNTLIMEWTKIPKKNSSTSIDDTQQLPSTQRNARFR